MNVGFIFKDLFDGAYYRVLMVFPDEDEAIVTRIRCSSTRPEAICLSNLASAIENKKCLPVEIDDPVPEPRCEWSEGKEAAFARIEPALNELFAQGYKSLSQKTLWKELKQHSQKCGVSPAILNRAFSRVLMAGGRMEAAAADWHHCGARDRTIPRPTKQPNSHQLSLVDLKNIANGVRRFYVDGATWKKAYTLTLESFYQASEKIIGAKTIIVPLPKGQRPSFAQFYWHGKKLVSEEVRLTNLIGKNQFDTNHRGMPNGQSEPAIYPGHVAEIDWTYTDIVAVSRRGRLAIGRLVLYAIVDGFSGLILAAYITLENASADQAGRAVLQVLEDKVELCAKFGLTITRDQWDAQELPAVLRCDKGEVDSTKTLNWGTGLRMRIELCPSRRGDLKGTVESFFAEVHESLIGLAGGTTGKKERLKDHPAVTAIYDIFEIQRLVFIIAIRYNARTRKRQAFTEGMIRDQVLPVPNHIYAWAKKHGCLSLTTLEEARTALLITKVASVTAAGIYIDGLRYQVPDFSKDGDSGSAIEANDWLVRARKRSWQVHVGLDDSTINFIWLWHRDSKGEVVPVQCHLNAEHHGFLDLSWPEYQATKQARSVSHQKYSDEEKHDTEAWARAEIAALSESASETSRIAREGLKTRELIDGADQRRNQEAEALKARPNKPAMSAHKSDEYFDRKAWEVG